MADVGDTGQGHPCAHPGKLAAYEGTGRMCITAVAAAAAAEELNSGTSRLLARKITSTFIKRNAEVDLLNDAAMNY